MLIAINSLKALKKALLLGILCSMVFFSCTKDKLEDTSLNDFFSFVSEGYHPRFTHFTHLNEAASQPAFEEIQAMREDLTELENHQKFLNAWSRKYGTAFWDYATKDRSINSSTYQIVVPMVKGNLVTAILVATFDDQFEYQLFDRNDVRRYAQTYGENSTENTDWLAAASKFMHFDLQIQGYNDYTFTDWIVKAMEKVDASNGDPKCDVIQICYSYIDWEDPSIVWTCDNLLVCGGSGGGGGPSFPGGTGNFPDSENPPGGGGNGTGSTNPDEGDPDFDLCGGPCFDCNFGYALNMIYPDNCDPLTMTSPGSCSIIGQISHPGNGCGLDAFIRKGDNSDACQLVNIASDNSTASVITSGDNCYITYLFRGQLVSNQDCFIVGDRDGGIGLNGEYFSIEYGNTVTLNLPRLQLFDIYQQGTIPIDSQYRCYHDCGCI